VEAIEQPVDADGSPSSSVEPVPRTSDALRVLQEHDLTVLKSSLNGLPSTYLATNSKGDVLAMLSAASTLSTLNSVAYAEPDTVQVMEKLR
jgi:hypothetical protein